jgi:hypothetical protein
MAHGRQERCSKGFWWGDLRERDHLENLGVDWGIILKWIFKKRGGEPWTGLICFRIGTGDGAL